MTDTPPVTALLQRLRDGDRQAEAELLPLVYEQLHGLARRYMRDERSGHTLQPTALVNEAWMKIFTGQNPELGDRGHFLRVAAKAMRHVLVDHARAKKAMKRGQRAEVSPEELERMLGVFEERSLDVLVLNESLEKLFAVDEELGRIVELRYFAGLTIGETAEALAVSPSSVERGWRTARAWLRTRLEASPDA